MIQSESAVRANVTIFQGDIVKVKEALRMASYMFCHAFVDVVTRIVMLHSQRTKIEIPLCKIVVLLKKQKLRIRTGISLVT